MNKVCSKCHTEKNIDDFGKDKNRKDGHYPRCKECVAEYFRSPEGREANHRAVKRYEKTDKAKAKYAKYRHSEKGRIVNIQKVRRHQEKHPNQKRAGKAVNHAVEYGRMPRVSALACVDCGEQAKHYHHHKGYEQSHWLDVVPLCIRCHRARH